jgi:hypothetical protein
VADDAAVPVPAVPVIACDEPVFNFGTHSAAAPVSHAFTIWNRGAAPLEISHVRACCGGSASIAARVVAPGGSTTVHAVLNTRDRTGDQTKSIYLSTNDPERRQFRLGLVGRIAQETRFQPASVVFRRVTTLSAEEQVVAVSTKPGETRLTNAVCSVTWLRVGVGLPANDATPVTFATVPPLPNGLAATHVRLLFDDRAVPVLEIPVTMVVGREISALPWELVIGASPEQRAPVSRIFQLRSEHGAPFEVLKIECPSPEWTAETTPGPGGTRRVTIRNVTAAEGLHGTAVRVTTDSALCPAIEIPVRVLK